MSRITTATLRQYKQQGRKFATITAYDASFARLFDAAGIEVMLVGDSLGMVLQGQPDTLQVTLEQMAYHLRCVRAGSPNCLLIGDLPFMSYATPEQAYASSAVLMQAGANVVKLEGGRWLEATVAGLTERGVPVCAHLGLTPQSVHLFGGYKVQGRDQAAAQAMIDDALRLQQAGAQLLVLECIPAPLAAAISSRLEIPVIGIGAGAATDGQILVMHDLLGLSPRPPRFSHNFLADSGSIDAAVRAYVSAVQQGSFPTAAHSFGLDG